MKNKMINVIGLGYIGLPTSLMLASHGVEVVGTDINKEIVDKLRHQNVTFKEDGLEELLERAIEKGIRFSEEYEEVDYYIIAVPTPYDAETKRVDSVYLEEAVKSVIEVCKENATIIVESTVSPGTIDRVVRPVVKKSHKNCNIVHAPERILPGNMVYELQNNSRTIGADSIEVAEKVKKIYETFCKGEIVLTDIRTAEMTKVVENTFRDINIAFANELAKICRYDNMDVYEIIKIANRHPRVNILNPGPGVGGHCISVDPWFLVGDYPKLAKLISTARNINDSMPEFVIERIKDIMKDEEVKSFSEIGLYGLTYKPNVDDTRESPTLQLLDKLNSDEKNLVKIYDPMVDNKMFDNQCETFEEFLEGIKILVIMVDHDEIKNNEEKLKGKIILDTKNIIKKLPTYKL